MTIEDRIRLQVETWGQIGHYDLIGQFVLRNGKAYKADAFDGPPGTPKECFSNATHLALDTGLTYCEGYFHRGTLPILIHHAWCVDEFGFVHDPTIADAAECEYFGVEISEKDLRDQMIKNGVYGILDTGMINVKFLFAKDNKLEADWMAHRKEHKK